MSDITCESIQEKILLCEELTDAEKNHIAHCEECREASLQTQKMISDLGKMSVPGIEDGIVADKVMKEIRDSKIFYYPKFKLSNHIGTVAALVIVVAMFAAVKLSDNVKLDANNSSEMSDTGDYVMLADSYDTSVQGIGENVPETNAKFMAPDMAKEKMSDDSDSVQNEAVEEKSQKLKFAMRATSDEEQKFEDTNAVETDSSFDSMEEDVPQMSLYVTNAPSISGSAGGSGGGAVAVKNYGEEIFEESVSVEADEAAEETLFLTDLFDENKTLEENVDIANEYVKSIYEDANVLKAETLYEMQISSKLFIEWISTVETVGEYTFETLYSYVQNKN